MTGAMVVYNQSNYGFGSGLGNGLGGVGGSLLGMGDAYSGDRGVSGF